MVQRRGGCEGLRKRGVFEGAMWQMRFDWVGMWHERWSRDSVCCGEQGRGKGVTRFVWPVEKKVWLDGCWKFSCVAE